MNVKFKSEYEYDKAGFGSEKNSLRFDNTGFTVNKPLISFQVDLSVSLASTSIGT
jgi:hypothetical protein